MKAISNLGMLVTFTPRYSAYLGPNYLSLVFKNYYQKRFSVDQLAEYLGVKVTSIAGLEIAFMERG